MGAVQILKPFALSLSKGSPERSEGTSLRSVEGFDFAQPERKMGGLADQ
jgi:hypothetical protein